MNGYRTIWAILLALLAAPATAQDLAFSADATEACLAGADTLHAREACVGASADVCMETTDGQTTYGMGFCINAEYEHWDGRLNTAYQALMALETATADELKTLGSAAASPAAALRDMQRAWITWRDAACLYEYSQWGGGTGAGPASGACMMSLAGRQALALEDRLSGRQAQ